MSSAQRGRRLAWSTAALVALAVTPALADRVLFAAGASTILAEAGDVGALCLVALQMLLAPIHRVLHLALAVGVAYALWDRVRAWRAMRRLLALLAARPPLPGEPAWVAALAAGISPRLVRVSETPHTVAFTAGWMRPRVYVSSTLVQSLTAAELRAVLAHEAVHVRRRDPLRLSLLRLVACVLFWLPALRHVVRDLSDEVELSADDGARGTEPLVLASAIVSVARLSMPALRAAGSAAFLGPGLVERRVRRLAGEQVSPVRRVTRWSLAGAGAVLALAWSSGVVGAHPAPLSPGQPARSMGELACWQHPGPAVLHIICAGMSLNGRSVQCPHMSGTARSAG